MQRLRPNMSNKEMDQLCTELVGMFAYNAYLNKPVRKPEQVERFLALSTEEREAWQRVEMENTTEALGAAPVAIVQSLADGIAKSDKSAQAAGETYCKCNACNWGRTVITSFMLVRQRQEEQQKRDVEDTKLN